MASHRTLEGRNPIWRAMTAILGVIALVAGMTAAGALSPAAPRAEAVNVQISSIQAAMGSQSGGGSNPCFRYLPSSGTPVSYIATSGNVTTESEAIASHGYPSGGSCGTYANYSDITSYPSAVGIIPAQAPGNIDSGSEFLIGMVLHHNNTIATNAGQNFAGSIQIQLGTGSALTFPWKLWESPNQSPCNGLPYSSVTVCDDTLSFDSMASNETITLNGQQYKLIIDGFYNTTTGTSTTQSARNNIDSCTKSGDARTVFQTAEKTITTACLYGHLAELGTLEITKAVTNSVNATIASGQKYSIAYTCYVGDAKVADGSHDFDAPGSWSTDVPAGAACTVTETSPANDSATGLPTPGYHWSVGYSNPNPVTIQANVTSTVTVTNTVVAETPHLTLKKTVDNTNGGTKSATDWTLKAQHSTDTAVIDDKGSSADGGATATIGADVSANVSYTLSESGPDGYTPGSWQCTDDSGTGTVTFESGAVTLAQGQHATCAITNTAIAATGTMTKTVTSGPTQNPNGTWTIGYTITVTNQSEFSNYVYDLDDTLQFGAGLIPQSAGWTGPNGTSGTFTNGSAQLASSHTLAPNSNGDNTDTYSVTVTADVTTDATSSSVQCVSGGNPTAGGFLNRATVTHGTESIVKYACAQPGLPTISKTGNVATQNSDGSWNVSYDIAITNPTNTAIQANLTDTWPTLPSGWILVGGVWNVTPKSGTSTPNPSKFTSATSSIWSGTLPKGTYTFVVSGQIEPSASAQSIGVCSDTNGQSGLHNTATVTSGGYSASAPGCVSIPGAGVIVAKSVAGVNQLPSGNWQIDYTVTVTNQSAEYSTFYTLTDTPALGNGFTVKSQGWEGVSPATNQPLAKKTSDTGVDTYTYRVVASFDSKVADPQLTCNTDNVGAFANSVTVTFPGGSDTAGACAAPKGPTVTKTFAGATQNSDGNWVLTYDVAVTNGTGQTLAYTVNDTAATLPAGATAVGDWTASGPVLAKQVSGTDAGTLNTAWDGSGTLATGLISTGAKHTYSVSRTVKLAADASAAALQCAANDTDKVHGFWNSATVDNGVGGNTSSACGGIQPPSVDLAKTVTSTVQQPDGTWVTTYAVTATNNNDTAAVYSLTDRPQFGDDIAVSTATWRLGTGGTQNFSGSPLSATLATDKSLSAHTTDTYTVVVTATVPSTAWNSDHSTLACTTGEQYSAGGFLNTATITSGGTQVTKHDCSEPVQPTVNKKFVSATPNSAGGWDVTYTVTVTNPAPAGGPSTTYDLSDTPTFPSDLTVTAATATLGTASVGTWDSNTKTLTAMATGKSLAAGASDVYTIVVSTAKPQQPVSGDVTECGAENPSPGQGFYNRADLSSGGVDSHDDACGSIPAWTLRKDSDPVTGSTVNPGSTIKYTLTVVNTGPVALTGAVVTDDLSNVLNHATFGSVVSDPVPGTVNVPSGTEQSLTWHVPDVPVGDSVSLQYTVTVSSAAYNVTLTNVAAPDTPGGQCEPTEGQAAAAEPDNANCTTTHRTPNPPTTITPLPATLSIMKTASPTAPINPGDAFTYSLAVSNTSTQTASSVHVTDPIPADIAVSSATGSNWTCTITGKDANGFGGSVACDLGGSLAGGASAPAITLAATLSSTTTAVSVSNTGSVTWTNPDGSNGGPASSTATIGVIQVAGESSEITPTTTSSAVVEVKPTSSEVKPTSGAIAYTGVNTFGMGMLALLLLAGGALILGLGTVWRRKPRKH